MLPPNNRRSCAGLLIPLPPGLAFYSVRPHSGSSLRIPAYGVFKNANHRPQHALRFRRTKTWRRPRLHPNPSMHRRVGPAIQIIKKMAGSGAEPQILVQYLVLRKDLSQPPFSWPTGALVAQACHAATAALHLHRDHPYTAAYLQELGRMRKVVLEVSRRGVTGRRLRDGCAEAGSRSTRAQTLTSGSICGVIVGGSLRDWGHGVPLELSRCGPSYPAQGMTVKSGHRPRCHRRLGTVGAPETGCSLAP